MAVLDGVPQSRIGHSTGRFWLGNKPIIVMNFYCDGSESHEDGQGQWLTLAGFVAGDSFWGRFERAWEVMLHDRYPKAPYLHMYELLGGEDPFESNAGWKKDKINALVVDAVKLLNNIGVDDYHSYVCSVDIKARQELVNRGSEIQDPHVLCANWCIGHAFRWYFDRFPVDCLEPAYLFFDRDEGFYAPFKKQWEQNRTPPGMVVKSSLFWDWIEDIQEKESVRTPGLQAADLLAWGTNRSLYPKSRSFSSLAEVLWSYVPTGKLILDAKYLLQKHPPPR